MQFGCDLIIISDLNNPKWYYLQIHLENTIK